MSWLGEVLGDRFPNAKNALGTLEAKLFHNNLVGKVKYFWRGLKVSVVNAFQTFKRNAEDTPMHFVRLDRRVIQVQKKIMEGKELTTDELELIASHGDASKKAQYFENMLAFVKNPANVHALETAKAKAEGRAFHEAESRKGQSVEQKERTRAENLEVFKRDEAFAVNGGHKKWRQDWQSRLILFGGDNTGVTGTVQHFNEAMQEIAKKNVDSTETPDMRDTAMVRALQGNLVQLEEYQDTLNRELDTRYEMAEGGVPVDPERLKTLKRYAAHDAIQYTKDCITDKRVRGQLMLAYKRHFLGVSSIRPALQRTESPEEFKAKIAKLEALLNTPKSQQDTTFDD
ncbi:hypothetical protein [Parendozoicomonas sp. Alg238-R29]|uniref:hypothetical protein n=1 Tax=Parendozoicomonas sp. Alg238-R29 TaxID=2993446 RepID=UPI00248DEC68|nr:hypothetical protein [Parendozoicomonas sp. Alg238-R29]